MSEGEFKVIEGKPILDVNKDSIQVVSGAIVTASGSLVSGYNELKGTFNVNQINFANQINFETKLHNVAEYSKKLVELTQQQIENAEKESKKQRNRFYIGLIVGTIIGIVGIIIAVFK